MGGLVIETIRPGVQFIPDAAAAFRRAEAQVRKEFGRNIDVNSTYRSWATQLAMYNAWNAYVNGTGPYPGHSRAIHPMYSRHVNGDALDSDDWTSDRIRNILADNGFIRNQLHVPNEKHHFEYIASRDNHRNERIDEDDMPSKEEYARAVWDVEMQEYNAGTAYASPAETTGRRLRRATDRAGRALVGVRRVDAEMELMRAQLASVLERQGSTTTQFYKHGDMPEGSSLWLFVTQSGDFVRIRDNETAALYKEMNGGFQSTRLSKAAIRQLRDNLLAAGGRDLSAVEGSSDTVPTTRAQIAADDASEGVDELENIDA